MNRSPFISKPPLALVYYATMVSPLLKARRVNPNALL
jgi:hypothetical protein